MNAAAGYLRLYGQSGDTLAPSALTQKKQRIRIGLETLAHMNNPFKVLFSSSKPKSGFGQSSLAHSKNDLASVQDGSENAVRQQLIQTLHRELMRKHGIPVEWMACHTQVMVSRTKGTGMSAVLVVRHWDERLQNHAFAFQRALAMSVIEFEPAAERWLHGITWRLDVASSCPHIDLPEKSYWNDLYSPAPTAVAAAAQKAELANIKNDFAALETTCKTLQAQLATSQAELQSQTARLAAESAQLARAKLDLAAGRAERATFAGSGQRPAQRTQFMPHKAVGAPAAEPASPSISAPDDSLARSDLDRLFAIRDTALRQTAATPSTPLTPSKTPSPESSAVTGYEVTQPAPLQR